MVTDYFNFFDQIDKIFSVNWDDTSLRFNRIANTFPFCDIYYSKDNSELSFQFAIAGYEKENLEILIDRGNLIVEHPGNKKDVDLNYFHEGLKFSGFKRIFTLPDGFQESEPEAKLEDGILTINLKIQESKKPKRIEVK